VDAPHAFDEGRRDYLVPPIGMAMCFLMSIIRAIS
jgi:hypothetical protein